MEIEKITKVVLTPDEIKEIVTMHLQQKGLRPQHIRFNIEGHYQGNDARFKTYELESVECTCK